jgi:hypothetical protein
VLDNDIFSKTQIKTLNLRGNILTMKGDVPLLRAPHLEKLDLGSCGITTLSPKTFQNMLDLKELMLDENCLNLPVEPDPQNNIFSRLHQLSKLDLSSNEITVMNSNLFYGMNNLKLLNLSFNPAVCDDCKGEGKCIQFRSWCSSRSDKCGEMCNLEEASVPQRNCINTFVSEDTSPSEANTTTFLNIWKRREEIKVNNERKEVENGKVIAVEQNYYLTVYLLLGAVLSVIVIGVVLAIIIRRRRHRSDGGYLQSEIIEICN